MLSYLLAGCQDCTTYAREEGRGSLGNVFSILSFHTTVPGPPSVLLSHQKEKKPSVLWPLQGRGRPPDSSKGKKGSRDLAAS